MTNATRHPFNQGPKSPTRLNSQPYGQAISSRQAEQHKPSYRFGACKRSTSPRVFRAFRTYYYYALKYGLYQAKTCIILRNKDATGPTRCHMAKTHHFTKSTFWVVLGYTPYITCDSVSGYIRKDKTRNIPHIIRYFE